MGKISSFVKGILTLLFISIYSTSRRKDWILRRTCQHMSNKGLKGITSISDVTCQCFTDRYSNTSQEPWKIERCLIFCSATLRPEDICCSAVVPDRIHNRWTSLHIC